MDTPRRPGRPRGERTRWSPALWLTPAERAEIETAARAAAVSASRFVVEAALERARHPGEELDGLGRCDTPGCAEAATAVHAPPGSPERAFCWRHR